VDVPVNLPLARPSAATVQAAVGTALAAGRAAIAALGTRGLRAGRAVVVPFGAPGAGSVVARLRLGHRVIAQVRRSASAGQVVVRLFAPGACGSACARLSPAPKAAPAPAMARTTIAPAASDRLWS